MAGVESGGQEPPDAWQRVGRLIEERMEELLINQAGLVRRSGVSANTLRALQAGGGAKRSKATLARVERALDWPSGAIRAIADGSVQRIAELPHAPPDPEPNLEQRVHDLRVRVDGLEQLVIQVAALVGIERRGSGEPDR